MDKKDIQRQRMRKYFTDAAKRIIQEEGVEAVSARKVGQFAGYSYATIYNYFTDINELLWYTANDILLDVDEALAKINQGPDALTNVFSSYKVYIDFYFKHPAFFRFFFLYDHGETPAEIKEDVEQPDLHGRLVNSLHSCAETGLLAQEEVEIVADIINGMVHGFLMMHFSHEEQLAKDALTDKINQAIRYLLHSESQSKQE